MRLNSRVASAMPSGREGFRELVLTTPVCGAATCHVGNVSREERTIDGMLFLNRTSDPTFWTSAELDRMASEWNEFCPDGVEADPAYLAALCRHVARSRQRLRPPAFVTLTYELATRAQHRAIAAVLPSKLYSLYGATEAGVLFMEGDDGRLRHNSSHSHVELIPMDEDAGETIARVVVTTLGRAWMPLCRYDIGDLVRLAPGEDGPGYRLARVEGRLGDSIMGAGRCVTPAMLDDVIAEAEPETWQWQLEGRRRGVSEEEGKDDYVLHLVGSAGERAARRVASLLGAPVAARREAAISPEASGKYRLVRSRRNGREA